MLAAVQTNRVNNTYELENNSSCDRNLVENSGLHDMACKTSL